MSEQPQAWDTSKAAEAYGDAQQIVLALSSSDAIGAYQEALGTLMEARLDDADSLEELRDRLAYVLYGFAMFGSLSLASAEAYGGVSQETVLAGMGKALDNFLG